MRKAFIIFIFLSVVSFASEFGKMSTQELIAVMGYVKPAKEVQFLRELKQREPFMDKKTRKLYEENLKKYYGKK